MTLLDAPQYDPTRDRRRLIKIIGSAIVILVLAGTAWFFRYWPEEHAVDSFFTALQKQDYETAYGIWMHDPQWKDHQAQYARYPFNEFYRDWGPGGEWGIVKSYKIDWSGTPQGGSSGVIVEVIVNERNKHTCLWVEKSDKTLGFSPFDCPGN